MRTVRLTWKKSRMTKKKKAAVVKWTRQHYDNARDMGPYMELKAPVNDTKYIWIFMLTKAFSDIE